MKASHHLGLALIASCLAMACAVTQASQGYAVMSGQEGAVKKGMSMAEVERELGAPAARVGFGNVPGPTWSYHVADSGFDRTVFDVDFGADGTVISMGERLLPDPQGGITRQPHMHHLVP